MLLLKNSNILTLFISLTLFSLPLYLLRCNKSSYCYSSVPFTFLELLILITFFLWFFLKFAKKRNILKIGKEIRSKIPLILQIIFVVFIFSAGLNILFSPDKVSSIGFYKAYFIEPFLLFVVIFDYLSEKNNLKRVFWAFLSSSIWISLVSIFEKLLNYSPFNALEYASRGRVGAIYQTSNSVGLLVGPVVVLLISYLLYLRKENKGGIFLGIKETNWVIISLITVLGGLLASGSRGAWFGVIGSCLFFFGFVLYKQIQNKFLQKPIKKVFIGLIIVFFSVNIGFLFNINFVIRATNKLSINSQVVPRLCLWESAVNIIKEKPLIGSGLGGFATENETHHTCSQEKTTYPHNIFLNFWLETGIFGLISFVGICTWFFFNLISSERLNYLKVGLASVLISLLFHGLVDVPYLKNDLSAGFWTILAISLYLVNQDSLFKVVVRRLPPVRFRR